VRPAPQVIGHIQTRMAAAPQRAAALPYQVVVCDPLPGRRDRDPADGRIGIRFIDATVFNLSTASRGATSSSCDSMHLAFVPCSEVHPWDLCFQCGEGQDRSPPDRTLLKHRGRALAAGSHAVARALTFSILKKSRPRTRERHIPG